MSSIPNFLIIPTLNSRLVSLYTCCSLPERLLIRAITLLLFYPCSNTTHLRDPSLSKIFHQYHHLLPTYYPLLLFILYNTSLHLALYIYLYICLYSIVSFHFRFTLCVHVWCMSVCVHVRENQIIDVKCLLLLSTLFLRNSLNLELTDWLSDL